MAERIKKAEVLGWLNSCIAFPFAGKDAGHEQLCAAEAARLIAPLPENDGVAVTFGDTIIERGGWEGEVVSLTHGDKGKWFVSTRNDDGNWRADELDNCSWPTPPTPRVTVPRERVEAVEQVTRFLDNWTREGDDVGLTPRECRSIRAAARALLADAEEVGDAK